MLSVSPATPFADPVILFHIAAAMVALVLGPVAVLRASRDRWHRLAGRTWVLAMALAAISSFGILGFRVIGPFSPIHILSVLVLWMLWRGVRAARAGRMVEHGRTMVQLYVQGAMIPAMFTLLPGRRMHALLLDGTGWVGFALAAAVFTVLAVAIWRRQPALPGPGSVGGAAGQAGGPGRA